LNSVIIAGQIPLVPASMALPSASETLLAEQVVLSLQHLWRIASEMKVQCWSSAVAYFSRQRSADDACESARLAGQAWTLAHGSPDEEDDDDNGPDPWDLKYNPRYQSLAGTETKTSCPPVPDWSVYTLRQQNEPGSCIPPVFAAEIESLPRDSLVEWHAHNGLKGIREGCAELIHLPHIGTGDWQGWHMIVSAGDAHVLYTTMAYSGSSTAFQKLQQQLSSVYQESLHRLQPGVTSSGNALPYLGYVDMNKVNGLWASTGGVDTEMPFAVVPCHSLWSSSGERLAAVVLYRTTLTETGSFLGSE
jgi:diphthine-ammonia ligase